MYFIDGKQLILFNPIQFLENYTNLQPIQNEIH